MDAIEQSMAKRGLKGFRAGHLYRKETFMDVEAGEIIMLIPVTDDGGPDLARAPKFFSNVMVNMGPHAVPVPFELEGVLTLPQALAKWADEAADAAQRFVQKVRDDKGTPRLALPPGVRPS